MRKWITRISAIDPKTGVLCDYQGPTVEAETKLLAQAYCDGNNLGYCRVMGQILNQIKHKSGEVSTRYSVVTVLDKTEMN